MGIKQVEQLFSGMDVQLLVDVAHMGLGGAVGNDQLALDHAHGLVSGEQLEDLQLSRREVVFGGEGGAPIVHLLRVLIGAAFPAAV